MRRWAGNGLVVLSTLLALAGCGGGGGGGGDTGGGTGPVAPRAPLPALSVDEQPAGDRIDMRAERYFPARLGDRWHYGKAIGGTSVGSVVRQVIGTPEPDAFRIAEGDSRATRDTDYRRSGSGGLLLVGAMAGVLPVSANALVGEVVEYAEPFHAVGTTRRVVRQGGLGRDDDGDALQDSFRLEYTQVFLGFEPYTLPDGRGVTAARFRSVATGTVQPSRADRPLQTRIATEDSWWGPGIGLLRADRTLTDDRGAALEAAYRLELTFAQIDGGTLVGPPSDSVSIEIALPHRALVFDAGRALYYASVPGSVAGRGHRIAIIDADGASIGYSPPVGTEPGALALAPDGSALYVGVDGSGDVLKLRLPDFAELQRTRLPAHPLFGQQFAHSLAVSPTDADVVAVSMAHTTSSPFHAGIVLLKGGVLQPQATPEGREGGLLAFAADGRSLFAYNNLTTDFRLRRLSVLPDGVTPAGEADTTGAGGDTGSLDLGSAGLVVGTGVYRLDDLALVDTVKAQDNCRAAGPKLVCLLDLPFASRTGSLVVLDAATLQTEARPTFELSRPPHRIRQIVVGPPGQVALRSIQAERQRDADTVTLLRSPALP